VTTIHDTDGVDEETLASSRSLPPVISTLDHRGDWLAKYPNWWANIHCGVPRQRVKLSEARGYLVFEGALSPKSGLLDALWIARKAERPLCILASGADREEGYLPDVLLPKNERSPVQLLLGISEEERYDVLSGASALIVPSALGNDASFLTAVEALAAGTPTLGRRGGPLDDLVVDGLTGFTFDDKDEAVRLVGGSIEGLQRAACRARFERHYTIETMADRYEEVYERLIRIRGPQKYSVRVAPATSRAS
jgi:glycosyltransferase involved in cell wall biosynthesis